MKTAIVDVPGISLSAECGLRREPTRPVWARTDGFEEKFDGSTLFYAAVLDRKANFARVIAPPLFNLSAPFERSQFLSRDRKPLNSRLIKFDRQTQIIVESPRASSIDLSGPIGSYHIPLTTPQPDIFGGLRAIFTLSRNNNLSWIQDWLRFHVAEQGAQAVLLYDNNSDDYTTETLLQVLTSVRGVSAAVIVRWPFKHGPTGAGRRSLWDSNFSQLAMLEHARWVFLQDARSVLSCDIDELVISRSNATVFEAVEKSWAGALSLPGEWIVGLEGVTRAATPAAPAAFRDYEYALRAPRMWRLGRRDSDAYCKPKWAAVPSRAPENSRWHVHNIEGWLASRIPDRRFKFRHFREISKSWKYDRTRRAAFDPGAHQFDDALVKSFRRLGWIDAPSAVDAPKPQSDQLSSLSS